MSRAAHIVRLFAEHAEPVLAARCSPTRCLNGTRVCIDVLRQFGVKARPVSVRATVMNAAFRTRLETLGRWPTEAEMDAIIEAGGWAIGVDCGGTDEASNAWGGHLVAVAQQRWLVDAGAVQMHRPAREIVVPPVFVGEVGRPFLAGRGGVEYETPGGGTLAYRARLDDESWRECSGFQPHAFNAEMVREIADRIRRAA